MARPAVVGWTSAHRAARGANASLDDWNPFAEIITPRDEAVARYDELYELYRRLYVDTADVVHALEARQGR